MKVVSKREICISYELYLFCQPILFPKEEKGGIMRHLADSRVNKEKPGGGSGDRITL